MIAVLLLVAAALPATLERQILSRFPRGGAPGSLSTLLDVPDGRAHVLVLCAADEHPRAVLARVSDAGTLDGEPVEIAYTLSGRRDCGSVTASDPFTLRRKGQKAKRGVVLSFADGPKPFLAVAITTEPDTITLTDGPGAALKVRKGKGDTSFCERQSDGSWAAVSWVPEAGEWSPTGTCPP
jgi:hypothetical protein